MKTFKICYVSSEVSLQVQADWGSQSRTGSDLKGDSGPDHEVTVNVYTGSEEKENIPGLLRVERRSIFQLNKVHRPLGAQSDWSESGS